MMGPTPPLEPGINRHKPDLFEEIKFSLVNRTRMLLAKLEHADNSFTFEGELYTLKEMIDKNYSRINLYNKGEI